MVADRSPCSAAVGAGASSSGGGGGVGFGGFSSSSARSATGPGRCLDVGASSPSAASTAGAVRRGPAGAVVGFGAEGGRPAVKLRVGRSGWSCCLTSTAPAVRTAAVTTPATALAPIALPSGADAAGGAAGADRGAAAAPPPRRRRLLRRGAAAPALAPPAPPKPSLASDEALEGDQRRRPGTAPPAPSCWSGSACGSRRTLALADVAADRGRRPCAGPRPLRTARPGPRRRSAGGPGWPRRARSAPAPAAT